MIVASLLLVSVMMAIVLCVSLLLSVTVVFSYGSEFELLTRDGRRPTTRFEFYVRIGGLKGLVRFLRFGRRNEETLDNLFVEALRRSVAQESLVELQGSAHAVAREVGRNMRPVLEGRGLRLIGSYPRFQGLMCEASSSSSSWSSSSSSSSS